MARLRVKNLKQVENKIRRNLVKVLRSKSTRDGVGNIVVEEIKDGDFGRPSEGYRQWREENDSLNKTDPKYNRDKINITFTGELLKDLKNNVRLQNKSGKTEYVIEHSDKIHKSYKTQNGRTKRSSYKKISEGVSRFYNYLTFSSKTKSKVIAFIRKQIERSF